MSLLCAFVLTFHLPDVNHHVSTSIQVSTVELYMNVRGTS